MAIVPSGVRGANRGAQRDTNRLAPLPSGGPRRRPAAALGHVGLPECTSVAPDGRGAGRADCLSRNSEQGPGGQREASEPAPGRVGGGVVVRWRGRTVTIPALAIRRDCPAANCPRPSSGILPVSSRTRVPPCGCWRSPMPLRAWHGRKPRGWPGWSGRRCGMRCCATMPRDLMVCTTGPRSGRSEALTAGQQAALKAWVLRGPRAEPDRVGAWRLARAQLWQALV